MEHAAEPKHGRRLRRYSVISVALNEVAEADEGMKDLVNFLETLESTNGPFQESRRQERIVVPSRYLESLKALPRHQRIVPEALRSLDPHASLHHVATFANPLLTATPESYQPRIASVFEEAMRIGHNDEETILLRDPEGLVDEDVSKLSQKVRDSSLRWLQKARRGERLKKLSSGSSFKAILRNSASPENKRQRGWEPTESLYAFQQRVRGILLAFTKEELQQLKREFEQGGGTLDRKEFFGVVSSFSSIQGKQTSRFDISQAIKRTKAVNELFHVLDPCGYGIITWKAVMDVWTMLSQGYSEQNFGKENFRLQSMGKMEMPGKVLKVSELLSRHERKCQPLMASKIITVTAESKAYFFMEKEPIIWTLSHSSLSVDTDWFRVACAPFLDAAYVPKLKIAICCTVQCRVVAVDVKAKVMKYDIPAAALITSLGWKFDDGRLVLGDVEGKIYFWDSLASFSRAGIPGHPGPVTCIHILEGTEFAVTAGGKTMTIWNVTKERPVHKLESGVNVHQVAFEPQARLLAVCGDSHVLSVWNPIVGKRLTLLTGHRFCVNGVAFSSPDTLWSCDDGGYLMAWSMVNFRCVAQARCRNLAKRGRSVACIGCLNTDAEMHLVLGNEFADILYQARGTVKPSWTAEHMVRSLVFLPKRRTFVVASGKDLLIYDGETGNMIAHRKGLGRKEIAAMATDTENHVIVMGDEGGHTYLVQPLTGELCANGPRMKSAVVSLEVLPGIPSEEEPRLYLVSCRDGSVSKLPSTFFTPVRNASDSLDPVVALDAKGSHLHATTAAHHLRGVKLIAHHTVTKTHAAITGLQSLVREKIFGGRFKKKIHAQRLLRRRQPKRPPPLPKVTLTPGGAATVASSPRPNVQVAGRAGQVTAVRSFLGRDHTPRKRLTPRLVTDTNQFLLTPRPPKTATSPSLRGNYFRRKGSEASEPADRVPQVPSASSDSTASERVPHAHQLRRLAKMIIPQFEKDRHTTCVALCSRELVNDLIDISLSASSVRNKVRIDFLTTKGRRAAHRPANTGRRSGSSPSRKEPSEVDREPEVLFTADNRGSILMWATRYGYSEVIGTCEGHTGDITNLVMLNPSLGLCSCDVEGTIFIWNLTSQQFSKPRIAQLLSPAQHIPTEIAFYGDKRYIYAADNQGFIHAWNVREALDAIERSNQDRVAFRKAASQHMSSTGKRAFVQTVKQKTSSYCLQSGRAKSRATEDARTVDTEAETFLTSLPSVNVWPENESSDSDEDDSRAKVLPSSLYNLQLTFSLREMKRVVIQQHPSATWKAHEGAITLLQRHQYGSQEHCLITYGVGERLVKIWSPDGIQLGCLLYGPKAQVPASVPRGCILYS